MASMNLKLTNQLSMVDIFNRDLLTIEDKTIDNSLQEEKEQFCYNYSFAGKDGFC